MIRVRKIVYQVHMDRLDGENVVDELSTKEPLTLYAHQLEQLPQQVAEIVKQAETQAATQPATPAE